jgi:glycosyltransferase involved in cell wall biosynthesis
VSAASRHEVADRDAPWRTAIRAWGSVLCVSTADYGAPSWTNKQHIASRLASELPVVYIESLGLRRPRLSRRDMRRILNRLSASRSPAAEPTADGPRPIVLSPVIIPFHSLRAVRAVHRWSLDRLVDGVIAELPRPRLLWTYNPVVVDELSPGRFDSVVYHCVDDLATMPRVSARAVNDTEPRLVATADAVFTSSRKLFDSLSLYSRGNVHLVHNVADADHFARARLPGPLPYDLSVIPEPRALFVGTLNDYKIDWMLLSQVARRRADWSFVLVGPSGSEATLVGIKALRDLPNVYFLGYRPYSCLPEYLRGASAGLIPYKITPHTEAVFPLKMWEYLAAGLPVVSTSLPALRAVSPPIAFADNAQEFGAALDDPLYSPEFRMAAAHTWTWDTMVDKMFAAIPSPRSPKFGSASAAP